MRSFDAVATAVFWISAALVLYTYVAYPVVLRLLTWGKAGPTPPRPPSDEGLPTVSVLIVAHNEEHIIRERLQNLLSLDYPVEKLELAVASDGSRDRTNAIVAEYAHRSKPPHAARKSKDDLTEREREIVTLVGQGLTNEQIATKLYLSVATVRTHVGRAMTKLSAGHRAQLVIFAYETGLVAAGWEPDRR